MHALLQFKIEVPFIRCVNYASYPEEEVEIKYVQVSFALNI